MPPNDNICAGADNKLNKTGAQNDQNDSSANSNEGQVVINHNHYDTPIQKSTPSTQKRRGRKTNAEKLAEAGSQNGSLTEYLQKRPADSTRGTERNTNYHQYDRTPEDTTRFLNSLSYLKPQKVKHNTIVVPKQKRNDASVQSTSSTTHRSQIHDNNANQRTPQTTSSQSHNMRNDGADNTGRIRTTTRPEAMRAGELKFEMEEEEEGETTL
ncbi:hypothetical protein KQX54_008399 [Cotesia glomerata]|uniref:Uncharacterized protein n=1 Tax=Cotesia glomerata TaxID=32391 RepID=A0AAV7HT16_COTGL|nr:hypothetical protein KQX54_008399 [Cotesia glomerata]